MSEEPKKETMVVTQIKIVEEPLSSDHLNSHCANKEFCCVHLTRLPLMPWKTYCNYYHIILNNGYNGYVGRAMHSIIEFGSFPMWHAEYNFRICRPLYCDKQELIKISDNEIKLIYEEA